MKRHLPTIFIAAVTALVTIGAVQSLFSAFADQSERVTPTTGIYTGPQFSQKIGDLARSVSSANKGPTAPANVGGSSVDGLEWLDDSVSPWIWKRYVNGGWAVQGAFDPSDSSYAGVVGGGLGSIGSASTTDLGSVPQANVTISGTTTITGFGSSAPAGVVKFIRFSGALKLTNSSSLTVPGGFDLTTAANDRAIVTHLGSGVWEITQYTRASGIPVDIAAVGKPEMTFAADAPDSNLYLPGDGRQVPRSSFPAYLAKETRIQNGTRTSGNATITGIANTATFGVGMPVESTGVNAGCTIASFVVNTSITLNSSACVTASGTSAVTVFVTGYGSGGGSTTVGIPDCRGRGIVGIDPTGTRLTATYFGASNGGANPNAMAVWGGSESHANTITEMAAHNHGGATGTPTIDLGQFLFNNNFAWGSGNTRVQNSGGTGHDAFADLSTYQTGGRAASVSASSISSQGGGAAHPTASPAITANCFVRVVP